MKKLLAILLVLAMIFSVCGVFTACDSENNYVDHDEENDEDDHKDDEDDHKGGNKKDPTDPSDPSDPSDPGSGGDGDGNTSKPEEPEEPEDPGEAVWRWVVIGAELSNLNYPQNSKNYSVSYNDYGLIDQVIEAFNNGTNTDVTTYTYDARGNMTRKELARNGQLLSEDVYTYNKANQVTEYKYIYEGRVEYTYTYTYDDAGKLTERCEMYASATAPIYFRYSYNDKGFLMEESKHEAGQMLERKIYTVNDLTGKIMKIDYYISGSLQSQTTYSYGMNDLLTHEIIYSGGYAISTQYTYDTAGRLIVKEGFFDGAAGARSEYTYDSNGCLIQVAESYQGRPTITTTYANSEILVGENWWDLVTANQSEFLPI